jgi:uncharacterized membrane protein YfcA
MMTCHYDTEIGLSKRHESEVEVMSALMVLLGVAAGVLAGLFGIGGGVIMVVGLVALFKLPFTTATGTSLAAMLLPVGAFGVWVYWKAGNLDFRAAGLLALGLVAGTWVGARLANDLPPALAQRGFALFMVVMAVRMWMTAR